MLRRVFASKSGRMTPCQAKSYAMPIHWMIRAPQIQLRGFFMLRSSCVLQLQRTPADGRVVSGAGGDHALRDVLLFPGRAGAEPCRGRAPRARADGVDGGARLRPDLASRASLHLLWPPPSTAQ